MDNLIVNIIDIIAESENRGKELMIDSFILGIAWGRKIINTVEQIKKASNYLYILNQKIEQSLQSPFQKLDLFDKFLIEENYNLFPETQEILKKKLQQENQKQLPDQVVGYQKNQYEQVCNICDFYINDLEEERCQIQQCGHQFHNLCLYMYMDKQVKNTCPTCENNLNIQLKEQIFEKISKSFKSCCPNPECDQEFVYYGQPSFECLQCNFQCCLNCKYFKHEDNCKFEMDHFAMELGQRFKICFDCFDIIILNFTEQKHHKCKLQDQPSEKFNKVKQFFKQIFQLKNKKK